MSNIFTAKYCNDIFDISQIRRSPLTNNELKEVLPYKEDRNKYLDLIKELYMEAFLFSSQPNLNLCSPKDYTTQLRRKHIELLDFCLLNNMIDREAYIEHGGGQKEWQKNYIPRGHLSVKVFNNASIPLISEVETLEEYRIRIEESLAERETSWYLDLRYNFSECFSERDNEKELTLYYYDSSKGSLNKAEEKSIIVLWQKINADISDIKIKLSDLKTGICDIPSTRQRYDEQLSDFVKIRELHKELSYLYECLDIVEPYYAKIKKNEDLICDNGEILYIYKRNIKCHKQNHNIIQATAICYGRNDKEIELNVEYCSNCKRYFLEYSLFERYRSRYGILIGNFRMNSYGIFSGEYDLALESPLKLSGYSVGQKEGYSSKERQYILARIIHNNIMSKGEVIKYLSYFIKMQGSKIGNEKALEKWEEDLSFVQNYNIKLQPSTIIKEIKKY